MLTVHRCCILQAKANRGILYVDEVNLLDDGLVDVVLDSSASGVNTVEREGVGIVHPAKFIMIGSGNPQVITLTLQSALTFLMMAARSSEGLCPPLSIGQHCRPRYIDKPTS